MSWYYPLSGLLNGIMSLAFSIYVLLINRHRKLNRAFSLLAFIVAYWNVTYFIWLIADNRVDALFWIRVSMMGPVMVPAVFFHFVAILLKLQEKNKKIILANYFISTFLAVSCATPFLITSVGRRLFFKYWPVPGIMFHVFLVFFCLVMVYSFYLLVKNYTRLTGNFRIQVWYVSIGALISALGGMTNYFLFYNINIPPLGQSLVSVYIVSSGIAIIKYRLLDISVAIRRGILFSITFVLTFSVPILIAIIWESNFVDVFGRRWWIGFFIAGGLLSYVSDVLYNYLREREDWSLLHIQKQNQAYLREASADLVYVRDMKTLVERIIYMLNIGFRISQVVVYLKENEIHGYRRISYHDSDNNIHYWPEVFEEQDPLVHVLNNNNINDILEGLMTKIIKMDHDLIIIEEALSSMKLELVIPIYSKGSLHGFIFLGNKKTGYLYTQEDFDVLLTFANQTALAIKNIIAEEALIDTEQKYQELIRTLPEIVFELDREGRIVYINERATDLLGYSREELLQKKPTELVVNPEVAEKGMKKVLSGDFLGNIEFDFIKKDGSIFTASLYFNRIKNNTEITGISGIAVDMTDVIGARKALGESEEKFRTMIEGSLELIIIVDKMGVIRYQSRSHNSLLGYEEDELLGRNVIDFIHQDDRRIAYSNFNKIIKNPNMPLVTELRFQHKDGTWRYLESTGTNFTDNRLIQGVVINTRDVTERKEAERLLQIREERYRSLYNNALVGMITTDIDSSIIIATNDLGYRLLGYTEKEDLIGCALSQHFVDNEQYQSLMDELQEQGSLSNREVELKKKDNTVFWAAISQKIDTVKEVSETVLVDITRRKVAEQQAHNLAFYDQLTGLANRETLLHLINTEVMKISGEKAANYFAIFCIGLDRMSYINTLYGRNVGDQLLIELSKLLQSSFSENALVARYEGDKFIILFSKIKPNEDFIRSMVRKASDVISTHEFLLGKDTINLTASIGVSIYPNDSDDPEEIIKNSEAAMYMAKDQGENSFSLFDTRMYSDMLQRIQFEKELQDAIDKNEFFAHYQPKIDRNRSIVGMESLIRWKSPGRGIVNPIEFIPLSEKNGMIIDIGNYILKLSLEQTKELYMKGYKELRVAVNLSPIQFSQPDIIKSVKDSIIRSELDPAWLELEITETSISKDEHDSIKKLNEIHDMGIAIAIDDFGTGYSSLSKLKDYPIDTLKIDKSFVENLPLNKKSAALVSSIIELAHNLNFNLVAEGVETREQLEFLMKLECDYFQGNYFSMPVSYEELKGMIMNGKNFTH